MDVFRWRGMNQSRQYAFLGRGIEAWRRQRERDDEQRNA